MASLSLEITNLHNWDCQEPRHLGSLASFVCAIPSASVIPTNWRINSTLIDAFPFAFSAVLTSSGPINWINCCCCCCIKKKREKMKSPWKWSLRYSKYFRKTAVVDRKPLVYGWQTKQEPEGANLSRTQSLKPKTQFPIPIAIPIPWPWSLSWCPEKWNSRTGCTQ